MKTSAILFPNTILHWQVYGTVMHINRGNPAQHEVVVDSWPEFKAVLTRPCKEVGNIELANSVQTQLAKSLASEVLNSNNSFFHIRIFPHVCFHAEMFGVSINVWSIHPIPF